jgi:uncharacterized membrane protein YfcA
MSTESLILLAVIIFLTSIVGVVTGSNSLINVPAMFQLGIEPKVAVATNMFGLVFMAIGGTIPFVRQRRIDYPRTWPLAAITLVSSGLGAFLVGFMTGDGMKLAVTISMIAVIVFTLIKRDAGVEAETPGRYALPVTYLLVFLLGIYGGFYSGGYVTMLTAVCIGVYGMTYGSAVGSTKLINVFSCGIATAIFMWQGLVDYKLGVILAVIMFVGGYVGAHFATKMDDKLLRRIFLAAVLLLAIKTMYDFFISP